MSDDKINDLAERRERERLRIQELIRADQESINAAMGWPPDE